jgi:hypothetical protein
MTLTFNVGGRILDADQFKAQATPAKKAAPREVLKAVTDRSEAKLSMGFVVTGYPALEIAQAKESHERAMADGSETEPFELSRYARKHKPTKGRFKPFEVEASADDCAALLKRMGWHLVTVTELMKG